MEGGGTFRARFGVERDRQAARTAPCARTISWPRAPTPRFGDQGRLSRVHLRSAQEARLGQGPQTRGACRHRAYRGRPTRMPSHGPPTCPAVSSAWRWRTDAARTAMPRRAPIAWNLPDPDPGASRADLHGTRGAGRQVSDPAERKQFRLPNLGFDVQSGRGRRRVLPSSSR